MNALFRAWILGCTALLSGGLALLLAGLAGELLRTGLAHPPPAVEVLAAVRLTLGTATIASLLAVALATPVAWLLSRHRFPGKALLDTLLDLPVVLSPLALGALLLIFLRTPAGRALDALLGPFVFEVRGIVLAQAAVVVGLAVRLLKATFDGIDPEHEEVARTLGLDQARVFLRIALPLAWPGIVAAWLLVWARAAGEFGATVMVAGATPLRTETLPVAIQLSFERADLAGAMTFIALLVGLSSLVLIAVRWLHGR